MAARSAPEALVVALAVRAGWSDEPDNDQDLRSMQGDDICFCDSFLVPIRSQIIPVRIE